MPELRVAIVEKSLHFDRKVGEATTEVSGCFLTKRLGLAHHLTHHHIQKQGGWGFWFNNKPDDPFEDVGELGSYYQVRLPSYQVDREVLDAYLLELAVKQGRIFCGRRRLWSWSSMSRAGGVRWRSSRTGCGAS